MYTVMSIWEALPGKQDEFTATSKKARAMMRVVPGIEFIHGFVNESGQNVVMMGYSDEATYNAVINDPNGPFAKVVAETGIDNCGRWVSSQRGPSTD